MLREEFDAEEVRRQAEEISALIENLRPSPTARLQSRAKVQLMAAISGDDNLIEIVRRADHCTLFWEVDGELIEQRISLSELPAA